MFVTVIV
jgi:hypothetical protein